jgi:hypothetical protein
MIIGYQEEFSSPINGWVFFFKTKGIIAKTNPLEITKIHLRGWHLPTNASPYTPAGDQTQDWLSFNKSGSFHKRIFKHIQKYSVFIFLDWFVVFIWIWTSIIVATPSTYFFLKKLYGTFRIKFNLLRISWE